ncbi:MAG: LAGLIDADG family homing endonuclease [Candidatus Micrarchaeota archaeon]
MALFADLHLHSKYARATSENMDLEHVARGARDKGLGLVGTGDFTHPTWFKELRSKLEESPEGSGFFSLKGNADGPKFMLQVEVATFKSTPQKVRKVHHVICVSSFDEAAQLNDLYSKWGNLAADGRPMFGNRSCAELVEKTMQVCPKTVIFSAHSWTPFFGVLGSESGFDSLEEAYEDQVKHVFCYETGMSCYDPETEVLTNNGWKKILEVTFSDEVCTLNAERGIIQFQKPLKLFEYDYKGKMYRLKTKRIDLFVTPNHKLLYARCDFRKKPVFFLKEAEALFNKSKRFKKDGIWVGTSPKYFVLPCAAIRHGSRYYSGFRCKDEKKFPIKPWLKFFGFWIAEGWTTKGKDGDYGIYLANSNTRLMLEMKHILEGFGYTPYFYKNRGIDVLRLRDYQLFYYLKQFGKASEKHLPPKIKSLSKELLQILFDYYIKGDGNRYGRTGKGLRATTISKRLRDDLQEIALKIGISAYYKLLRKKGTPIVSLPKAKSAGYKQSEDSWNVYFIRHNLHTILPSTSNKNGRTEAWVNYDGKVYCLEVPNHVIYVRRNGIPVWCGNSDPAMCWRLSKLDSFTPVSFSDSHSFWPWRLGRECNAFSDEVKSFDELWTAVKKKDSKNFLFTVETDPAYGKYHWDGHRNCSFSCPPSESRKLKGICPVCKRPLTIGVEYRVEQLADRPEGFVPKDAIPYKKLLPLHELLATVHCTSLSSKKVMTEGTRLMKEFGSELNVLLDASREALLKTTDEKIVDAILLNREAKIKVKPGFDGEYGVPQLPSEALLCEKPLEEKPTTASTPIRQKSLGEW